MIHQGQLTSLRSKFQQLFLGASVFVVSCLAFAPVSAFAAQASEDLTVFAANAGDYLIDPASGPYCKGGYTALNVALNLPGKTLVATFTGKGEIHGSPTAGQWGFKVSLTDTIDLPSFPGSKKQRTVVYGKAIIDQTWSWSPLAGEFGGWKNAGEIFQFENADRLVFSAGGFNCPFVRAPHFMD